MEHSDSSRAIIIAIGDELLIGQTLDTNSHWLSQQLNTVDIQIQKRITVPDTREALVHTLESSFHEADIIILTGGLGPTKDDITKNTLNDYFGGALQRNPTVLAHIHHLFQSRNRTMLPENEAQADVPNNCTVLFNRMGTAPGMLFQKEGRFIASLPGVPLEMRHIFTEELLPRIKENFGGNSIYHYHILTAGIGESILAQKIADIEDALPPRIKLAYLPDFGEVKLRLTATGASSIKVQHEVQPFARLITERINEYIVAHENITLNEAVVKLLIRNRLSLSTAESCTGGFLASQITDVQGSSEIFMGGMVSYSNNIKQQLLDVQSSTLTKYGAVSEATVIEMAENCRTKFKTDIAIALSGILGPSGGTPTKPVGLVYIAITSKNGTRVHQLNLQLDRVGNKIAAVKYALNLIRKTALTLSE